MSAVESMINTLAQSVMVEKINDKFTLLIAAFEFKKVNMKAKAQLTINNSFVFKINKTGEEKI